MFLSSVRLQQFRSVQDATLPCEQLTALVGPNGSGKSAFLRALDIFYTVNPSIDAEDFYNCQTDAAIEITLTFTQLEDDAREQFRSYLRGDDLAVMRRISCLNGKFTAQYHGSRLQNSDFTSIRQHERAAERKIAYENVRNETVNYCDLPKWISAKAADAAMLEWEKAHPDQCGWERDDGNFFGFTTVAQGYLGKYTNFIYIPAVRDAALDAREGKGAPITMLIDWLVRETLASETDVQTFREQAQHQYVDILRPALAKLKDLGAELSQTLQTYVPGATIDLSWIDAALLEFPAPRAEVKLVEDNFSCGVTRTGHGLQRAFILTVLQHLAVAKSLANDASNAVNGATTEERSSPTKAKRPSVLLAIEEPEIYQHPNRQRYFAKVLLDLTTGARQGVALSTQVVYTTHSPLLVGIDRFNQIRRLSKVRNEADKPKVTQISHTTFDQIAEAIWIANDRRGSDGQECQKFQGETIRARLHTLMTPWVNEGFFADVVVLVEGEDDRAAIIGTATSLGHDFESVGISIIPSYGKPSMDRLIAIFQKLNIPCYAVWDSDFDKKDTDDEQQAILINQRLLRLMNRNLEEFPEFISENCACFKSKLETTARLEIGGPEYDELLQRAQIEFGYSDKKAATKSPFVISKVLSEARDQNRRCKTFELLVAQILALKTAGQ